MFLRSPQGLSAGTSFKKKGRGSGNLYGFGFSDSLRVFCLPGVGGAGARWQLPLQRLLQGSLRKRSERSERRLPMGGGSTASSSAVGIAPSRSPLRGRARWGFFCATLAISEILTYSLLMQNLFFFNDFSFFFSTGGRNKRINELRYSSKETTCHLSFTRSNTFGADAALIRLSNVCLVLS